MALPGAGEVRRNVEGRRNGRASNGVRWDSFPKVKVKIFCKIRTKFNDTKCAVRD
jgi:hypothetical protein